MSLGLAQPWLLLLAPLALWLLWRQSLPQHAHPGLSFLPVDPASRLMFAALRVMAATAFIALILAAAGPYAEGGSIVHTGNGAQIVLVFDRSGSMSEDLSDGREAGAPGEAPHEAKIVAARRLLLDFMQQRRGDMFGVVAFASSPIAAAPLTDDREMTQAALASAQARSLGFTALARALALALDEFRDLPYTASRVLLLVSDGGAQIAREDGERLRRLFAERRASLIWIYTRGEREPSLRDGTTDINFSQSQSMHDYFAKLDVPYQLLEATSSQGMREAVAQVARMTNLPTHYLEHLPRRDLAPYLYSGAALLLLLLCLAKSLELETWPR